MNTIVFRVEQSHAAPEVAGLYMSGLAKAAGILNVNEHAHEGRHPSPSQDGIDLMDTTGHVSGFKDMQQLLDWVGVENIGRLQAAGGIIRVYDVASQHVLYGGKQVMFALAQALPVTTIQPLGISPAEVRAYITRHIVPVDLFNPESVSQSKECV